MKELSRNEVKEETVKLLKKLDNITKDLNISYTLGYGTLLGAIRHNGFIPWDDDLDVIMLRKDFDILCDFFKKNEQRMYPLKLCNRENTQNYYYGIPRLANMDFYYKCIGNEKQFDLGIFIDIYPLDNSTGNNRKDIKLYKKVKIYNSFYTRYINSKSNNVLKLIIKWAMKLISNVIFGFFIKKPDEYAKNMVLKYSKENSDMVGVFVWNDRFISFKKEWFNDYVLHIFEKEKFPIIKEYDAFLKKVYGDYMKLPPREQRRAYHGYKIYK